MSEKVIENGTIADAYIEILADRGVEYLFANAGTDFAPLIESLAKFEIEGRKTPRPITVPHENVAIHMALGYYLQTGKPQLVMVHVNVGMANAMCGVLNAWRGNLPVLFTTGRTPYSEEGGLMGARSGEIHWPQEMRDQGAMLREIVKWDYELKNGQVLESAIDRALNITMSEPKGPVYLSLPREVLAAPIENFRYQSPSRHMAASAPFPDLAAIDRAADMIAKAENPLIITASCGRDHDEPARLAALADLFAIPVTQRKPRYMALPSEHPMHLGFEPDPFIGDADLIIVLEADVPWIPNKKAPNRDAKIIHMGVDPLFTNYPLRGFPCDLAISGAIAPAMAALTGALETRLGPARDRVEARRKRIAERRATQRERWLAALEKAKSETPIHPAWVTHCLNEVKGENDIVLKEGPITYEHLTLKNPGTLFFTGAAGALGWSLGMALGMKAACPDRRVITCVGDGAYMFGNPIPAQYVAKAENWPTITMVFNNAMWGAVKRNTREVYPSGYAAKSNREPLTYFTEHLAFEKAADVAGGYGECVSDPAQVPKAIERAFKAHDVEKRSALLNIVCRGP
jgi:acetolactate synthase I/II/III large subunit